VATRIAEDVYGYENYDPNTGSVIYSPSPQAPIPLAPAAPAPTSSGGSGGGGGGGPVDFGSMIAGDPLLGQGRTDLAAESAADSANRAASVQRALIQYGLVPDFGASATSLGLDPTSLGYLQSDITPGTKTLAEKNTSEGLSIYARLQKVHKDQIRAIKNALAARGMAASGAMGYQLGEEALQYKQQLTDSEQQLLQYIMGAISAFTGAERGRQRTLAQYMMDAAQRQAGMYGDAGGGSGGGDAGSGQYPGSRPTGNGSGNFQMATSASQLNTGGGWGVRWEGPGQYEARKFPGVNGGNSDTVWVKVGDIPAQAASPAPAAPPPPAAASPAAPAAAQTIIQQILKGGVRGAV
jgi:hypothetical protein